MSERETLRGNDTPSFGFILKWLGILLGLSVVALVAVGLMLPREWHVELAVEIEGDAREIHALVGDVERWDAWMFDPDEGAEIEVESEGQGVGASVRWSGQGSRGQMNIVESDPATGVAWDGMIETDEINNHGSIRYEVLEPGRVRVRLVDEGTLPIIVGGYFVPVMNAGLTSHFEAALARLELAVEKR